MLTTLATFAFLAGCASAAERTADVCADISDQVAKLAQIQGSDKKAQIVPLLDSQLGIAEEGRKRLGEIAPDDAARRGHDSLLAAWDALTAATRAQRDAWENPLRVPELRDAQIGPGSDMVIGMTLQIYTLKFEEAAQELRTTAEREGVPECGQIPWRGGT
jgi:hypothetical protein